MVDRSFLTRVHSLSEDFLSRHLDCNPNRNRVGLYSICSTVPLVRKLGLFNLWTLIVWSRLKSLIVIIERTVVETVNFVFQIKFHSCFSYIDAMEPGARRLFPHSHRRTTDSQIISTNRPPTQENTQGVDSKNGRVTVSRTRMGFRMWPIKHQFHRTVGSTPDASKQDTRARLILFTKPYILEQQRTPAAQTSKEKGTRCGNYYPIPGSRGRDKGPNDGIRALPGCKSSQIRTYLLIRQSMSLKTKAPASPNKRIFLVRVNI